MNSLSAFLSVIRQLMPVTSEKKNAPFSPSLEWSAKNTTYSRAGDDPLLKGRLARITLADSTLKVDAVFRKKHPVNVIPLQGFFSVRPINQRDLASNRPPVQMSSILGRSDSAVRTFNAFVRIVSGRSGRNSVRVNTVELASRKIAYAPDPGGRHAGDRLFFLPPDCLTLGKWKFFPDSFRTTRSTVGPDQFAALFKNFEILAHRFIGDSQCGCCLNGSQRA